MDSSAMEIAIPTFINIHIFWIIPVKDLLLRSAMSKLMKTQFLKRIKNSSGIYEDKMVAVNIGDIWARAIIKDVVIVQQETKYICWLTDYGVVQSASHVFYLPEELKQCPHLAKQASLYNVVNLTSDLILGTNGYELQLKKTSEDVPGVRKAALNFLDDVDRIFFSTVQEDQNNIYGDLICLYQDNIEESITHHLISKNLIKTDNHMFQEIDVGRDKYKKNYFKHSPNWQIPLDIPEKRKLSTIIFNKNKKTAMEFFERPFNNTC